MATPTAEGQPGKMTDSQFRCNFPSGTDQGGVHTNSGIPNHAFALMVDGGTYNGRTISGIGLTKAAKIQYRALVTYLTSGADFADYGVALNQACGDLAGTFGNRVLGLRPGGDSARRGRDEHRSTLHGGSRGACRVPDRSDRRHCLLRRLRIGIRQVDGTDPRRFDRVELGRGVGEERNPHGLRAGPVGGVRPRAGHGPERYGSSERPHAVQPRVQLRDFQRRNRALRRRCHRVQHQRRRLVDRRRAPDSRRPAIFVIDDPFDVRESARWAARFCRHELRLHGHATGSLVARRCERPLPFPRWHRRRNPRARVGCRRHADLRVRGRLVHLLARGEQRELRCGRRCGQRGCRGLRHGVQLDGFEQRPLDHGHGAARRHGRGKRDCLRTRWPRTRAQPLEQGR